MLGVCSASIFSSSIVFAQGAVTVPSSSRSTKVDALLKRAEAQLNAKNRENIAEVARQKGGVVPPTAPVSEREKNILLIDRDGKVDILAAPTNDDMAMAIIKSPLFYSAVIMVVMDAGTATPSAINAINAAQVAKEATAVAVFIKEARAAGKVISHEKAVEAVKALKINLTATEVGAAIRKVASSEMFVGRFVDGTVKAVAGWPSFTRTITRAVVAPVGKFVGKKVLPLLTPPGAVVGAIWFGHDLAVWINIINRWELDRDDMKTYGYPKRTMRADKIARDAAEAKADADFQAGKGVILFKPPPPEPVNPDPLLQYLAEVKRREAHEKELDEWSRRNPFATISTQKDFDLKWNPHLFEPGTTEYKADQY